jgi:2-aminobenzoylacetyl-CoA thioesterase
MIPPKPPIAVTENLLLLGPIEYPLYLVQDQGEAALFEGGVGACGPVLEEQLVQCGISRESMKQLVVTHGHPDHVMAVPAFRKMFPGAQVLASPIAAATMGNEKAIGFFTKIDGALTSWLEKIGSITEKHRPQPLTELKIPVDRIINEGDTVSVGSLQFQVLATPGHSDCSLSFFEPTRKILIAADVTGFYMPEKNRWWPMYFSDYTAYLNANKRLAALGAEVLCLSHNAVIKGKAEVEQYFQGSIAATEACHQRIVDAVKAGKDPQELAKQMGAEVFAETGNLTVDFFEKNCSLLIKHSLRHEGLAPAK